MRIAIVNILILFSCCIYAQQEIHFTQFAYDKLGYNPAYAGAHDHLSVFGIYRNQWLGQTGSPSRVSLSANLPLVDQKLGLGFHLDRSTVSIFRKTTLQGAYAYKIKLAQGNLSLGLNTSLRQFQANWSDPSLRPEDGWDNDPNIEAVDQRKLLFNIGLGIYFQRENFFVGFSIPRVSKVDIDFEGQSTDAIRSVESRNYLWMAGGKFRLNTNWEISPQILIDLADTGPTSLEINLIGIMAETYHIGFNFSTSAGNQQGIESLDLIAGWQYSQQLFFGLSYDLTLSPLRTAGAGSLELIANYRFAKTIDESKLSNPRYF